MNNPRDDQNKNPTLEELAPAFREKQSTVEYVVGKGLPQSTVRQDATESSNDDRDRMLRAMHSLEAALARGVPSREKKWRNDVVDAAEALARTMKSQSNEYFSDTGLLEQVIRDEPRLSNQAVTLRRLHQEALDSLDNVIQSFRNPDDPCNTSNTDPSSTDIRNQLAESLTTIRKLQARESDLLYEAYQTDIGVGD